jgi:two-component system, NarL family, sensor histidine kinase DesK
LSTDIPGQPLPGTAEEVLAPVLREAVTNILRHATATACTIQLTAGGEAVRLQVSNDGVTGQPGPCPAPGGGGHGLANLDARVHAADGQLATRQDNGQFALTAQIPLPGAEPDQAKSPAAAPTDG